MKNQSLAAVAVIAGFYLMSFGSAGLSPRSLSSNTYQKGTAVANYAKGTFEVKVSPQSDDKAGDPTIGRLSIDKQFHGDLEGTSKGQMLAVGNGNPGSSGGYVAMERVNGTLNGRTGTFALQHIGTMIRGVPQISITVVPDSGTGQLLGIAGKMKIDIAGGKHSYEFEYTLPKPE
jgi:Protein of unknown function (DUF3224)